MAVTPSIICSGYSFSKLHPIFAGIQSTKFFTQICECSFNRLTTGLLFIFPGIELIPIASCIVMDGLTHAVPIQHYLKSNTDIMLVTYTNGRQVSAQGIKGVLLSVVFIESGAILCIRINYLRHVEVQIYMADTKIIVHFMSTSINNMLATLDTLYRITSTVVTTVGKRCRICNILLVTYYIKLRRLCSAHIGCQRKLVHSRSQIHSLARQITTTINSISFTLTIIENTTEVINQRNAELNFLRISIHGKLIKILIRNIVFRLTGRLIRGYKIVSRIHRLLSSKYCSFNINVEILVLLIIS